MQLRKCNERRHRIIFKLIEPFFHWALLSIFRTQINGTAQLRNSLAKQRTMRSNKKYRYRTVSANHPGVISVRKNHAYAYRLHAPNLLPRRSVRFGFSCSCTCQPPPAFQRARRRCGCPARQRFIQCRYAAIMAGRSAGSRDIRP